MKFEENLVKLRKNKGLSQEELAEKLDVSRQTIYKWESGQSYPELDRLMLISKLFNCTIDDLLNNTLCFEEVNEREQNHNYKQEYNQFYNRYSFFVALGVFFIFLGITAMITLFGYYGYDNYVIPMSVFFILLLVSLSFLIPVGIQEDHFSRRIPKGVVVYSQEERQTFIRKYSFGMVVGVGCIFLGIVSLIISLESINEMYAIATMFGLYTIGIPILTYFGCLDMKYKKVTKIKIKKRQYQISKINGVIMLTATILFLFIGFVFEKWHPAWIVFPIGGIACQIVSVIMKR